MLGQAGSDGELGPVPLNRRHRRRSGLGLVAVGIRITLECVVGYASLVHQHHQLVANRMIKEQETRMQCRRLQPQAILTVLRIPGGTRYILFCLRITVHNVRIPC